MIRLDDGSEQLLPPKVMYPKSVDISASGWGVVVDDRGIRVVEVATGKMRMLKLKDAARAFMVQPGVLAVLIGGKVEFLDAVSGKKVGAALKTKEVDDLVVSLQGVLGTVQYNTKTSVTLWPNRESPIAIAAWKEAWNGGARDGTAMGLTFSPDGSRLAFVEDPIEEPMWDDKKKTWGDRSSHVRVIDVHTGKPIVDFAGLKAGTDRNWKLVSNDTAIVLSEDRPDRFGYVSPTAAVKVLTVKFSSSKPDITEQLTMSGFDQRPAVGVHGVLVNRGLYLKCTEVAPIVPSDSPRVSWLAGQATAKKQQPTSKPKLQLPADAFKELQNDASEALKAISKHFEVGPFSARTGKKAHAVAALAAKALTGIELSSGRDWSFSACVLEGDLPSDPDIKIVKNKSAMPLLEGSGNEMEPNEKKAYASASQILNKAGKPTKIEIRSDDAWCTVLITLALQKSVPSAGVVTVYFDT